MRPELEAELDKIGWQKVKAASPAYAQHLEKQLSDFGADLRPQLAKAEGRRLKRVRAAMVALHDEIGALSPESRSFIDVASCAPEVLDTGIPPLSGSLQLAIEAIAPGVLQLSEVLDAEARRVGKGRKKNAAAYRIADALAEIYVIGCGSVPTIGKHHDTNAATGVFGKVGGAVFRILGVAVAATSIEPFEAAIFGLTDERLAGLLRHRSGAYSRRPPSMFD